MTTLTEKRHAGGFLISEADGHLSRDNGVLVSGQNLVAGTVLMMSTTKFTELASGSESSAVGILYASVDASAGDTPCVVIARSAEVNGHELVYGSGSPAPDQADVAAALAAFEIVIRN